MMLLRLQLECLQFLGSSGLPASASYSSCYCKQAPPCPAPHGLNFDFSFVVKERRCGAGRQWLMPTLLATQEDDGVKSAWANSL
jgi:hypothetical protein